MIRVLLADDHRLVRTGFRVILGLEDDIEVIGEAEDGAQAVAATAEHAPDVVLMDVEMPVMDGLEATRRIVAAGGGPSVLILTTFDRDDYLFAALEAGASGFLLKNSSPESLVEAVRVLARGDALLAPEITRRVLSAFARPVPSQPATRLDELTPREHEVLVALAAGATNAEIATSLHLGETTVKTHVSRVLTKLGARDRTQAVVMAYELGVVRPGQ
ncbi:response regulator transcription factor [Actinoplanes bogorensis]|uniref:Response regulator transcription factor n=1 Tax=Paractinoplanes bogorensis TaxID=1610840 RepID=A0ABS5YGV6_9ACTN|nr:response regulator transcription factor [Actinoplanes bogorensis]MBU2662226.1 response regulator transcription factor [Actinoplanes bogorensis]